MKTFKILFAITILIASGIDTYAKQRIFSVVNQPISFSKKHIAARDVFYGIPKNLIASENQFSRPGISKDYIWDDESNSWVHSTNTTYTYTPTGEIVEEIVQDANTDDYLTRNSTEYDEYGNLTAEISYDMNDELWTISDGYKYHYIYDNNGNILEEIDQVWNNGAWKNDYKYVFTLNQLGVPSEYLVYGWSETEWIPTTRFSNIAWHNWEKELVDSYIKQDYLEGSWFDNSRYTYSYNGNDKVEVIEVWQEDQWIFESRNSYILTENEEITLFEQWESGQWNNIGKYTNVFDSHGNITAYRYDYFESGQWIKNSEYFFDISYSENNDITETVYRNWFQGFEQPVNLLKYEFGNFLYYDFPTKTPEINSLSDIRIFPNPVKDSFTIQLNEIGPSNYQIKIANLAGQVVYNNICSEHKISVNISGLKGGMYILNVMSNDGKTFSQKLLKE